MDIVKGKTKEKFILQTRKVCRLIVGRHQQKYLPFSPKSSSRSKANSQVAPEGCFSVYVGSEKQRFVIKTEYANHPLFQMLLEDAELEYGYNSEGPILIPCEVNVFYIVLAEMRSKEVPSCCSIASGSCKPLASSYRLGCNNRAEGYVAYGLLNSHSFAIA